MKSILEELFDAIKPQNIWYYGHMEKQAFKGLEGGS